MTDPTQTTYQDQRGAPAEVSAVRQTLQESVLNALGKGSSETCCKLPVEVVLLSNISYINQVFNSRFLFRDYAFATLRCSEKLKLILRKVLGVPLVHLKVGRSCSSV